MKMNAIETRPGLSVIIPVRNRKDILRRVLHGLQQQDCTDFEVIVVDDGSNDGTAAWLAGISQLQPFSLRVLAAAGTGASAARNQGAMQARGAILLFLDADTIPEADLVRLHLQAHRQSKNEAVCVVGKIIMSPELMHLDQVRWHELDIPSPPAAVFKISHQHYRTANTSLRKNLFDDAGGFHPGLIASEDLEFAYRLVEMGVSFLYHQTIVAVHHHPMTLKDYVNKGRTYGKAVAYWHRMNPELHLEMARRYGLYHPSLPFTSKTRYFIKVVLVNTFSIGIILKLANSLRKKSFDLSDRLYKTAFGYYLRKEFHSSFHTAWCVLGMYC